MTRRRALAGAAVVVVLVAAAWWLWRRERRPARPRVVPSSTVHRLDVSAFRTQLARRRALAQQLKARTARPLAHPAAARRSFLLDSMVRPRCMIGPGELCAILEDPILECDDGDAQACLAIGQYLQDTPPRPLIAVVFFHRACKLGEAEACARVAVFKKDPSRTRIVCADDPLGCAWQAQHAADPVQTDEACTAGVADSCASMVMLAEDEDDPVAGRAYLEASCQLGNALACWGLADRLSPDCDEAPCYPPDPSQAAAASTIACEAGFIEYCAEL